MADSFEVSETIPASPDRIYRAWLDGAEHGAMTGGDANADANIGSSFDAWDGYISGTNLELEPGRRIVQAWRTRDFPEGAPDSRLEIELTPDGEGTRIMLRHTDLPDGQGADYEEGWREHYFIPMRAYFLSGGAPTPSSPSEDETARMPAIAMPPAEAWEPQEEPRREDDVRRPAAKKPAAKKPAVKAAAKKPAVKAAAKKPAAKAAAKKPAKKKAAPKKKAAAKRAAPKKKAAKKSSSKKKAKKGKR